MSGATVVHAAGRGKAALWDAVAGGASGLQPNRLSWCALDCWVGAVPGIDTVVLPPALTRWDCRLNRMAWLAMQDPGFCEAVDAAIARHGAHRVGVVLGTSTSGIRSTEVAYARRRESGGWPPWFEYRNTHSADALCRFVAENLGLRGPLTAVTTACSSSAKVFLTAQRWIESGLIDAAVVGGADSLCLSTLHGFDSLQLLSDDVCRPFDAARKGISIGEAAGFLLLDSTPTPIRFLGGGESSDAWHMSTPHPDGLGAQDAMLAALSAAGLELFDIGYVNAHGTGTRANDLAEAAALTAVFGAHGVAVSSTKGVTGHALGAAGIVEAIVTLCALERQMLPVSANVVSEDPQLELDLVTQPRAATLEFALSNNFGFGGSNCSLVFGRVD